MKLTTVYTERWMRLAVINLVVVAAAGLALRYKVTFPFPIIDFKNLLHAHSHFAFASWISTALFTLLINQFVAPELHAHPRYRLLFWMSQISSYGMLFSFLFQEYGTISIGFSTINIFVSYGYAYAIWQDTKTHTNTPARRAMRASLVFLIVSSIGPFALAYIIASHIFNGELLHNAIYWYLHFQYNGWFAFAVMALLLKSAEQKNPDAAIRLRIPLVLMLVACIPTYLLSIIWIAPPVWVYMVAGASGTLQLVALVMVIRNIRGLKLNLPTDRLTRLLLILSFISFAIKILLQFLSVFPALNQFVFGHRPVIIGYLHLVMLGFVSFFMIAYALRAGLLQHNRTAGIGILIFVVGVFFTEGGLMMQGFSGILYTAFAWTPLLLFIAAVTMLAGIVVLACSQKLPEIPAPRSGV